MPGFCSLDIHLVRADNQIPTCRLATGFAENNTQSVILGYSLEKGQRKIETFVAS
jgi:hypothetical protein